MNNKEITFMLNVNGENHATSITGDNLEFEEALTMLSEGIYSLCKHYEVSPELFALTLLLEIPKCGECDHEFIDIPQPPMNEGENGNAN